MFNILSIPIFSVKRKITFREPEIPKRIFVGFDLWLRENKASRNQDTKRSIMVGCTYNKSQLPIFQSNRKQQGYTIFQHKICLAEPPLPSIPKI